MLVCIGMNVFNPLGALLLAATVLLVGTAPAAAAPLNGPNCTWNPTYGCAWFDHEGDEFYVCDYNSDGNSVVVQYQYETRNGTDTGYAISRGRAVPQSTKGRACPLDRENHAEGSRFVARVCMAIYAKPGGKPIDVLERTCGGWWRARF
jgi:hypothetical protein